MAREVKSGIKNSVENTLKKLPYVGKVFIDREQLRAERDRLRSERDELNTWMPPGHFYSPIPSIKDVKLKEEQIFNVIPKTLPGIDLNEDVQLDFFNQLKDYYQEQPFEAHKNGKVRYHFENPNFSYADAIFLYCTLRHLKPKRIVEIGSGYSSCVTLDTNELFFDNAISCTFIEPYPQLLRSLLKEGDIERVEIIPKNLQDVDLELFSELSENDILFIDSSHVSKIDSDVNRIFFEILPLLKSGVYIHIHDIFYPFEYPKEWVYEGRAWNEAYILRTFLQYNNAFNIELFSTFLFHFHQDKILSEMPLCMKNPGGCIWLKKV